MNTGEGIITKFFSWFWSPSNDDATLTEWGAFLVLALIASFLWATVVHMLEKGV